MTDQQQFVKRVLDRVIQIAEIPDPTDIPLITAAATGLFADGFSEHDAVQMLRCMEEVNPELPEDIALARMSKLREKYRNAK